MERQEILTHRLNLDIISAWADHWFLLTAGKNEPGKFNTMTIAWGSIGVMWHKPFVMVVVRPSRHTYGFIEDSETFSLSLFPPEYKKQLVICGTTSGRDTDKIAQTGLTPIASTTIEAPAFDEAELILECKKTYFDDLKPDHFLDEKIAPNYDGSDYHRMYFGEIVAAQGIEKYSR
jgi:flavin reductase (DIM6/NTAB) family NADH-FMN oxidoreductase RutF